MNTWKKGSKAFCIRNVAWKDMAGDMIIGGPANGITYLIDCVISAHGGVYLSLAGEKGWWDSEEFRRVICASEQLSVES